MKKAILTVSYGVRDMEEMYRAIVPSEHAIECAFPEYEHFKALACPETVEVYRKAGMEAWHYCERMEYLCGEGYDVSVVALMLAPGIVYDMLLKGVSPSQVSSPLLNNEESLLRIGDLYGAIAACEDREVLLMGHGSTTEGDACYERLQAALPEHVHLACRQGNMRLSEAIERLKRGTNRRVLLMPLMLTAGRHARYEMAGDGPESWKNILKSEGFDVKVRLEGMGSKPGIQQMFVENARRIIGEPQKESTDRK